MPLPSPIHPTCHAHVILLDFITCTTVGEEADLTHRLKYNNIFSKKLGMKHTGLKIPTYVHM
jgi:hypothetical protein